MASDFTWLKLEDINFAFTTYCYVNNWRKGVGKEKKGRIH